MHYHKQRRQLEAKVTVYDCTALMSYSRPLALKLIVPSSAEAAGLSLSQVCSYNAQVTSLVLMEFCMDIFFFPCILNS